MNIKTIDDNFATTGQIRPDELKAISDAGFRSIVCARPDDEDDGQPRYEEIARSAAEYGLQTVHIPVSGPLTEGQIIRFHEAWQELPKPALGYCRSGARAGSLHATLD